MTVLRCFPSFLATADTLAMLFTSPPFYELPAPSVDILLIGITAVLLVRAAEEAVLRFDFLKVGVALAAGQVQDVRLLSVILPLAIREAANMSTQGQSAPDSAMRAAMTGIES